MPEICIASFYTYISGFLPLRTFSLASTPAPFTETVAVAQVQADGGVICPFTHISISSHQAELGASLDINNPHRFPHYLITRQDDPFFRYIAMFGTEAIPLPLFFLRLVREDKIIGSASFTGSRPFTGPELRLMEGLEAPLCIALHNILQHHELEVAKEEILEDNQRLRQVLKGLSSVDVIGAGRGLGPVMQKVRQAAPVDVPILITGETGTGKELIARATHELSARARGPFVPVNCGALPPTLIDSELFGHAKGAFTGAHASHKGYFERAEGGTLFLDELGELPLDAQTRLLRVLETHLLEKVGGSAPVRVDIRLVAATNRNLREMILRGRFREDLYYRLNVISIALPPLRQRKEDIPLLVQYLLRRSAARFGVAPPPLLPGEMERLLAYDWPGNVRELQNVLEEALVCSAPNPLSFRLETPPPNPADSAGPDPTYDQLLRGYFQGLLRQTRGRISGPNGAALRAGINASTFRFKCKKLGIALRPDW